jgi:hypothetical protein
MNLLILAVWLPIAAVAFLAVYLMLGWRGVVTAILAGVLWRLIERQPPG